MQSVASRSFSISFSTWDIQTRLVECLTIKIGYVTLSRCIIMYRCIIVCNDAARPDQTPRGWVCLSGECGLRYSQRKDGIGGVMMVWFVAHFTPILQLHPS